MAEQIMRDGAVVAFPRHKKRGAKVRKGPMADIVPLHVDIQGRELLIQWQWLFEGFADWTREIVDPPNTGEVRANLESMVNLLVWHDKALTPEYQSKMREQVGVFREQVEQRARLKRWLRAEGASDRDLRTPEMALEYLYNRGRRGP